MPIVVNPSEASINLRNNSTQYYFIIIISPTHTPASLYVVPRDSDIHLTPSFTNHYLLNNKPYLAIDKNQEECKNNLGDS